MNDPLYFLHIPKTGGMSVTRWLISRLPSGAMCPLQLWDDLAAGRLAEVSAYSAFHGHFGDNLDRLMGKRTRVITVLRDPLARTISHFRHVKRDPTHTWHQRVAGQNFDEFVADPANWPMIENFQARYLTALPIDLAPFLAASDAPARRSGWLSVALEELGSCLSPAFLREAALRRLQTACVVGTTERLADFCLEVARVFDFTLDENEEIPEDNTAGGANPVQPSAQTCALVEELTVVDREIYARACAGTRIA